MSNEKAILLTEGELRDLVRETVAETLVKMGVDVSKPLEMQKDFQHLRDWREATGSVKRKSILTVVAIIASGVVALLWIGAKSILHLNSIP